MKFERYSAENPVEFPENFRELSELHFPEDYYLKQVYLFARYSNQHGQEGEAGPVSSTIVT